MRVSFGRKTKEAFTLIELMSVVVIMAILMGLLLPALFGAKNAARVKKRTTDIETINLALQGYRFQYEKWPIGSDSLPVTYTNDNWKVVQRLNNTSDTRKWINLENFYTSSSNSLVDPWNVAYTISFLDSKRVTITASK